MCHVRFYETRSDRIYRDVSASNFLRQRFRKADQTRFGRHVIGLSRISHLADDRRDINYSTPSLPHHAWQYLLNGIKGSAEVCVDDHLPVWLLHPYGQTVLGDTRVVNQDVDSADFLAYFGDGSRDRLDIA